MAARGASVVCADLSEDVQDVAAAIRASGGKGAPPTCLLLLWVPIDAVLPCDAVQRSPWCVTSAKRPPHVSL